jgi:glycosyltransferase
MRFLIATPVLNGAVFAEDCVRAVSAAFLGLDYIHVIIDGGSRDGTVEKIAALGAPNVVVRSEPGTSMYEALNLAINTYDADIFYQINIDDLVLPQAGRFAEGFLAGHPAIHVVIGACMTISLDTGYARPKYCLQDQAHPRRLAANLFVPQPSAFVRLAVLRKSGGYDTRYRYAADTDLWLKIGAEGARFAFVPEILSVDRMHGGAARLTARHVSELAEVRAHWRAGIVAGPGQKFANMLAYTVRGIFGLFSGEGQSAALSYEGGALSRALSFLFSGFAAVRLDTVCMSGRYPIQGRIR